MTVKALIASFTQQEDLNFLLTNRIPRAALTRFMGWFSKIENPLARDGSIALWSELRLAARSEAVVTLADLLLRRVRLGLLLPNAGLDQVAKIRAIAQPELLEDVVEMGLHGALGDREPLRDLGVP